MTSLPTGNDYHIPVLAKQVESALDIHKNQWYIDGTIGGGGHAELILKAGGKVLGLDHDDDAIASTRQRLKPYLDTGQLILERANFRHLQHVWQQLELPAVAGILLDLGVSSYQLNQPQRGFRFDADNLDMRMDQELSITAAELIARLGVKDLSQLLADLGEERYAKHFAQVIATERQTNPITSGKQLADLLYRVSPPPYRRGPIHPATRTFQALRLAVNAELDNITEALPQATSILKPSGRLAVISFHSLEDRIVKHFMQGEESLNVITKRPEIATEAEVSKNPRARSAKLRVAEKI